MEILKKESSKGKLKGVIVQFGGQTPLKLAKAIHDNGYPILGTPLDSIDLTEDRERFSNLIIQLGLKQAENGLARSKEEAFEIAKKITEQESKINSKIIKLSKLMGKPLPQNKIGKKYVVIKPNVKLIEKKYKKDIELFNIKTLKQKRYSQNSNILILHRTAGHEVEPYSSLDEFRV